MSDDIAIKVENLSKVYKLYNSPTDRLKESLHPQRKQYHHDYFALNDVSFEISKGESVGIIGKNGSGKSTLLKILTGVLTPTSGLVTVNGKVSALLELGAGFNPELTGIENVYFNGMVMGYSREEMDDRLDDILSFADIGEFVYQPVKTYSSGMFVRLAFAVNVNVDPDILIVDEALAVGDILFINKCLSAFDNFKNCGKTILLVTHDMNAVKKNCSESILMDNGRFAAKGNSKNIVDMYNALLFNSMPIAASYERGDIQVDKQTYHRYGSGEAEILEAVLVDSADRILALINSGDVGIIKVKIKVNAPLKNMVVGITVRNNNGIDIYGINTLHKNLQIPECATGDIVNVSFTQALVLNTGDYTVNIAVNKLEDDKLPRLDWISDMISFKVYSEESCLGLCSFNSFVEVIKN